MTIEFRALQQARAAVEELPAPTGAAEAARAGALAWLAVYERSYDLARGQEPT